ncbi:hypothetical protein FQV27_03795 [Paracoccus aurantiacus]|uniref:Uncharacterized protein n=1 Tax=Paracoccus aurantiacus TaxID=2599412 RepID=A0A5C6S9A2_9RHOB|nr:hypothetical protein [Paracoccus aurantiacus]TXB70978.1 hypothetical protein FQV27_03795 [Paracoccus aurantiacus]
MSPKLIAALTVPIALCATLPAYSSSEDAWEEFRTAVKTECEKLVEMPDDATLETEVNPFGSEKFGAALMTVTLADDSADRMICIYDKQDKTAELTAPFAAGPH